MAKLYRVQLAVPFTTEDNVAQKCEYSVTAAGHSGRSSACGIGSYHSGGAFNEAVGCRGYGVTSVSENGEWWEHGSGKRRKPERKCCPIATLSATNPTLTRSFAVKNQRLTSLSMEFP